MRKWRITKNTMTTRQYTKITPRIGLLRCKWRALFCPPQVKAFPLCTKAPHACLFNTRSYHDECNGSLLNINISACGRPCFFFVVLIILKTTGPEIFVFMCALALTSTIVGAVFNPLCLFFFAFEIVITQPNMHP